MRFKSHQKRRWADGNKKRMCGWWQRKEQDEKKNNKRLKRWRRENKVCCSHLECEKGLCWEVACSDAIDRKEEREEVGNREVHGEQLKKADREGRRDLGLRNECGVKGGGLGVWVREGQSERRVGCRRRKQPRERHRKVNCTELLTERAGMKRCIFPASSVVLPLLWATSRCSPPLCCLPPLSDTVGRQVGNLIEPDTPAALCWHSQAEGGHYKICWPAQPRPPSPIGQSSHQSGTIAWRRLGEMGWEVKGCVPLRCSAGNVCH